MVAGKITTTHLIGSALLARLSTSRVGRQRPVALLGGTGEGKHATGRDARRTRGRPGSFRLELKSHLCAIN